jgi:hypothetical protein
MLGPTRTKYNFVQLGDLGQRRKVENAVGAAQLSQSAFEFDFPEGRVGVPDEYRLPNGGYDLDTALLNLPEVKNLPKPVFLVTSLPYGEAETGRDKESFWFGATGFEDGTAILSTYLVGIGACGIPLEPYVLMMIATSIFSHLGALEFHDDTRGCLFDYCDEWRDAEASFRGTTDLCNVCERILQARLRSGGINNFQIASARRILDRARNTRRCFLAMPFAKKFDPIRLAINDAVSNAGWQIIRADQIARPRRITDAIMQAILSCDLLLADISGDNPNVFYELGYAHACWCDAILLCRRKSGPIPFDIAQERTVFYSTTKAGLRKFKRDLAQLVECA